MESFLGPGVPGGLRGPHCVPDCVQPLCRRLVNSGRLGGTGRRQESDTGSSLRGACWLARHLSPPPTETTTLTAVTAFDPGHFFFKFFFNSRSSSRGHTRRPPHRMSLIDPASDLAEMKSDNISLTRQHWDCPVFKFLVTNSIY